MINTQPTLLLNAGGNKAVEDCLEAREISAVDLISDNFTSQIMTQLTDLIRLNNKLNILHKMVETVQKSLRLSTNPTKL
jgi:hypothetical protein